MFFAGIMILMDRPFLLLFLLTLLPLSQSSLPSKELLIPSLLYLLMICNRSDLRVNSVPFETYVSYAWKRHGVSAKIRSELKLFYL